MKLAFISEEDFKLLGQNHMSVPVQDAEHIAVLQDAVEDYMGEKCGEEGVDIRIITNLHANLLLCTPDPDEPAKPTQAAIHTTRRLPPCGGG